MSAISAILLAAGESRRMGAKNKLLMPVDGVPLVRSVATTLNSSMIADLVVVVGHEASEIEGALDGLGVRTVFNERYREGQMTSVHVGLEALDDEATGYLVCLSDQPRLTVADIDGIIGAFLNRTSGEILVPTFQGQRGNPIVLSGGNRRSILDGGRNLGCRNFIQKNPEIVTTVEWDCDHVVADIDTPEDYVEFSPSAAEQDRDPAQSSRSALSEKSHAR